MGGQNAQTVERSAEPPAPLPLDFTRVYDEYFDFVWANVRRLGVAPGNVDDAVQDVFLAVHRKLPGFEGRASLKTWLFHFILRVASSHRRSVKSATRLATREATVMPAAASTDAAVEHKQNAELLYRLLDELNDERRALFVLIELEEMTIPEAAEVLGLNVNTAYSRLRDARRDFEAAVTRERAREEWRGR